MSADRLSRISADCALGYQPSIADTWWLISQVQHGRALLASAEEAIRQLVTNQQVNEPTQQRCLMWSPPTEGPIVHCEFVAGHRGQHSWKLEVSGGG